MTKDIIDSSLKKGKAKGCLIVANDRGLHTRPSTEIVKCASNFKADIKLIYQRKEVNAKSVLGILMLAAPKGAKITIIATGVDAEASVKALEELSQRQFNISY